MKEALRIWDLRRAEVLLQRGTFSDSLKAQVLVWSGKWRDAEHVVAALPPSPFRMYLAGEVAYHRGRMDSLRVYATALLGYGKPWRGRGYFLLGRRAFFLGDYARADSLYRMALAEASTALDSAHALRQLGVLAWYRGGYPEADSFYQKALDAYQRSHFLPGALTVKSNQGLLQQSQGALIRNLKIQLAVLYERQRIGDYTGLSDSYFFLCNHQAYVRHMPGLCQEVLQQSYRLAQQQGYVWGARVARRAFLGMLQGTMYMRTQYNPALTDTLSHTVPEGRWFIKLSRIHHRLRTRKAVSSQEIEDLYQKLIAIPYRNIQEAVIGVMAEYALQTKDPVRLKRLPLERLGPWTRAYLEGRKELEWEKQPGKAYLWFQQATGYLDSLFIAARQASDVLSLEDYYLTYMPVRNTYYTWQMRAALEGRQFNRLIRTWEAYQRIRYWMGTPPSDPVWQPVVHLIRAIQVSNGQEIEYFEERLERIFAEFARNIKVRQQILKNRPALPVHLVVDSMQTMLRAGERHIGIFPVQDTLYTLLIHPDTVVVHAEAVQEEEVRHRLHVAYQLLRDTRYRPTQLRPVLHTLYQQTLAPLRRWLEPGSKLSVWAGQSWPLEAFVLQPAGDSPRYLAEELEVTYYPSLAWWVQERRAPPLAVEGLVLLAPAPERLPGTWEEVEGIELPGVSRQVYRARDATRARLEEALSNKMWIHVAGHALQDTEMPLRSFLEMADGLFYVHRFFHIPIHSPVVVLSACETGRGPYPLEITEDAYVTLPVALIRNGAQAVLTSRWKVDDRITARLMHRFYAFIARGHTLSEALWQARRSLLRENPGLHPGYWAAFWLMGGHRHLTTGRSL